MNEDVDELRSCKTTLAAIFGHMRDDLDDFKSRYFRLTPWSPVLFLQWSSSLLCSSLLFPNLLYVRVAWCSKLLGACAAAMLVFLAGVFSSMPS